MIGLSSMFSFSAYLVRMSCKRQKIKGGELLFHFGKGDGILEYLC